MDNNTYTLPLPPGRYPPSWMFSWNARTFAISHPDRVAYLLMPKAGSSSIRELLRRDYAVSRPHTRPFSQGGLRTENRFEAYRKGADLSWQPDYYKFTFVVDPAKHFVAGICEANKQKCYAAVRVRNLAVDRYLAAHFERRALHIAAALRGNYTDRKTKGTGDLNPHFAPQLFNLRAAASAGLRLDFLATLTSKSWQELATDMAARGFKPPGPLPHQRARGYTKLTHSVFAAMRPEPRAVACEFLREEYEAFEMPMGEDHVCAPGFPRQAASGEAGAMGGGRYRRRARRGRRLQGPGR